MPTETRTHAQEHVRSYRNLEAARQQASKIKNYDSHAIRSQLADIFNQRFNKPPYEWQLDVTEALILGLDCVVIAGTGAGKTMPFMMPLMIDSVKKMIIISPLKILQEDQAARFRRMHISAAAVNGDTWNHTLKKDIQDSRYQSLLTSPEMCLKHSEFRSLLTSSNFQDICAVVVDEAHCIAQWGGDFRTAYSELHKLRAFFPPHIPILATSATLGPLALREVRIQLGIDAGECFFLNLGNDRPNIAYSVHTISSSDDYNSLKPHLFRASHNLHPSRDDMIKSIVFTNSVQAAQIGARTIRSWLPQDLRQHIDFLHAHRSVRAKRRAMRRFRDGETLILVATEAAGMGADIPDIEQVVQLGVPSTLSVWMQRSGRAGRSLHIHARAILLVEKSMFEQRRVGRKKNTVSIDPNGDGDAAVLEHSDDEELDQGDEDNDPEDDASGKKESTQTGYTWKKKVEEGLREWIETEGCRRDIFDKYFGNPPERQIPIHICCDNCDPILDDADQRPSTPLQLHNEPGSTHTTPSKSIDKNGKRKMVQKTPTTRRGAHVEEAQISLETWRSRIKRSCYNPSPVTASAILPDFVIKTLASQRHIQSIEDIEHCTTWVYARRHGQEVLSLLKNIDDRDCDMRKAAKDAKVAERRVATAAKQLERKQKEAREREERQIIKAAEREQMQQLKSLERQEAAARRVREKEVQRLRAAQDKAERQQMTALVRAAKRMKTVEAPVLQYSSVFNLTPSPQSYLACEPSSAALSSPTGALVDFASIPVSSENINPSTSTAYPSTPTVSRAQPRPRPRPRPLRASTRVNPIEAPSGQAVILPAVNHLEALPISRLLPFQMSLDGANV